MASETDSRKPGYSQSFQQERRARVRFPFELRVRFRSLDSGYRVSGSGRVINMSSRGLLVSTRQPVIAGALLELSIEWPTRLDGRIPLQLVASGTVTRCDSFGFAVVLERYHFRLAGNKSRRPDKRSA